MPPFNFPLQLVRFVRSTLVTRSPRPLLWRVQSKSRQDDLLDNEDELAQDHAAETEQQVLQFVAGLHDHLDGGGESHRIEALQLDASIPIRLAALPRRVTELVHKIEIPSKSCPPPK